MMKQSQIKILNEELRSASWIRSNDIAKRKCPKPSNVKVAEKTVARYQTTVRREAAKIDRAYNNLKLKARHAIYFGNEKQAMLAVRAVFKFYLAHGGRP